MADLSMEDLDMSPQEKLFYSGVCPSLRASTPKREREVGVPDPKKARLAMAVGLECGLVIPVGPVGTCVTKGLSQREGQRQEWQGRQGQDESRLMDLGDGVGSGGLEPLVESVSLRVDGGPRDPNVPADDQTRICYQFPKAGHDSVFLRETRGSGFTADPLQHVRALAPGPARHSGQARRVPPIGPLEGLATGVGTETQELPGEPGVAESGSRSGLDHRSGVNGRLSYGILRRRHWRSSRVGRPGKRELSLRRRSSYASLSTRRLCSVFSR